MNGVKGVSPLGLILGIKLIERIVFPFFTFRKAHFRPNIWQQEGQN